MESIETLEVHVIGSGQGESIVVKLPTNLWGVVDCYTPNLRKQSANPTMRFLKEKSVSSLEFVCLTHPHADHFRGMSQLIDEFNPKYFWSPAAMSGQNLLSFFEVLEA